MDEAVSEPCPMCGSQSNRIICRRPLLDREWALTRCQQCRQHYTAPTPTFEQLAAFYAGDYHSALRTPGGTEAAFGAKYDRYADTVARHLDHGRVVDVGCSTGLLVKKLRDRGYQAEGIELNSNSAAWGREHYGLTIYEEPLERCQIPRGSLNALLFTDVIEHMQHPRDFLRDASAWLAKGGLALVAFPDISSMESRYTYTLSRVFGRDWLWSNCHIPLHVWEFTPKTAEACFVSAGFEVLEMRRSQIAVESSGLLAVDVLKAPLRCLSWPLFSRLFGTQMEFVIRKVAAS